MLLAYIIIIIFIFIGLFAGISLFTAQKSSVLNLYFAAEFKREGGFAGFLDLLLHQLYACLARPGISRREVQ